MEARIVKVSDKYAIQTKVLGEWVPDVKEIKEDPDIELMDTYDDAQAELKGWFANSVAMGLTENVLHVYPGVVELN